LTALLNKLPLAEMAPDSHVVVHAQGVNARVLSSAKGVYGIYLDGDGPAEITFQLPAGKYSMEWTDVRTGASSREQFQHGGGRKIVTAPAFRNGTAVRIWRLG